MGEVPLKQDSDPASDLHTCLKMILNGCSLVSGSVCYLNRPKAYNSKSILLASASTRCLPATCSSFCVRSSWGPNQELRLMSSKVSHLLHLGTASTSLLSGDQCSFSQTISKPTRQRRPSLAPRASRDDTSNDDIWKEKGFRYPPMTKKPRWWWRTLACLPYMLPFHETWMYAETAYHLYSFFEDFEVWTFDFLSTIGQFPRWFLIAYFVMAYLFIVRRKEWPHFFRFHVVVGLLLEILLQVVGIITTKWLPQSVYWGKIGMHFWTFYALAHFLTVIECLRCAIRGMYADLPYLADAAYIQIPYD